MKDPEENPHYERTCKSSKDAEEVSRTYYRAPTKPFKQIAEANIANGLVLVTEERPNGLCFHFHKKSHCYPTGRKIRLRGVVLDEYEVKNRY